MAGSIAKVRMGQEVFSNVMYFILDDVADIIVLNYTHVSNIIIIIIYLNSFGELGHHNNGGNLSQ